jgi:hypothetical protein
LQIFLLNDFIFRTAKSDLAVVQQYLQAGPSTSKRSLDNDDDDEELASPLDSAPKTLRFELRDLNREELVTARSLVQQLGGQVVYAGADWIVGPLRADTTPADNQVSLFIYFLSSLFLQIYRLNLYNFLFL